MHGKTQIRTGEGVTTKEVSGNTVGGFELDSESTASTSTVFA